MFHRVFIGLDTSNYTTSLAAVDEDGRVIANIKRLLPVAPGERGLRQSDAVFAHIKAVPELIDELSVQIASDSEEYEISAIGFSSSPRDNPGSYMPCFLVGKAIAHSIAVTRNIPVYSFSHQAGHVMAALYSADAFELIHRRFAAFHVSGGTTDLLLCDPDSNRVIKVDRIGGTTDLNAGQLIDRIGVLMGLDFPCGSAMDELACSYDKIIPKMRLSVNNFECNLSGAENFARKLFNDSGDKNLTAAFVFEFLSSVISMLTANLRALYPGIPVVFAGGVMSSRFINKQLSCFNGFHAFPEFSSDNAVGIAFLCLKTWKTEE